MSPSSLALRAAHRPFAELTDGFMAAGAWGAQDPASSPVDRLKRPLKAARPMYQDNKNHR
jgi:hypothetical protein